MWNSFDAIKAIVEQREKLLRSNRDKSTADDVLQKETQNQKTISEEFSKSKNYLERITENIQRLKKELAEAELAHDMSRKDLDEKSRKLELANIKFTEISATVVSVNERISSQTETLLQSIIDEYKGPEKWISDVNLDDDASNSSRVHALGDLHGWAPGLISYLTHHNLAKIEISGIKVYDSQADGKISLNIDSMCKLFPDLHDHLSQSDSLEEDAKIESFVHAGILGQPAGKVNPRSNYCQIDANWIGSNEFLFQIGDIFDRADHGEISAEILRQLIIQAPAHVFVLVGNHEEFLLCDQYNGWYRNETKWDYSTSRKAGNTRNLPQLFPGSNSEDLLKDTYEKYKQSAAMLFLTQYFTKRQLSSDMYGQIPYLSEKELEIYSNRILNGEWDGYKAASEIHEKILKSATSDGVRVRFPGALTLLATGDCIFMHAEPNGLSKYVSGLTPEEITRLRNVVQIGNREYLFADLEIFYDDERYSSDQTELLWARGASTGFEALDSKFAHLAPQIINIFPGVRNIIHGHSPIPLEHNKNKPHTYVGRILGNDVTPKNGEVRVYNIDEGITPVYQNKMSITEKMSTIPIGLQLPPQLKSLHESGEIIPDDETLWLLNAMYVERESLPFTLCKGLKLLKSPEQYATNGPGSIEINSKLNDKKYHAFTKEEVFRAKPDQFSFLSINKPEKMTNPLKGKKPPQDGVYRVQTKSHGSIALTENLLNILNISPFSPSSLIRKASYPFDNSSKVKKYVSNIMTGDSLWDNIVRTSGKSEIIACEGSFFTVRSTLDANILNFSILNMDKDKTFIISNKDDTTSSSILKINSKRNQCIFGSWTEKSAGSAVTISIEESIGEPLTIVSAILGECRDKPVFKNTNISTINYSSFDSIQAKNSGDNASVLEDETVRENPVSRDNSKQVSDEQAKEKDFKSVQNSSESVIPGNSPFTSTGANKNANRNLKGNVNQILSEEVLESGSPVKEVKAEKVKAEKVKAEKVKAEKAKAEKAKAELVEVKAEKVKAEKIEADAIRREAALNAQKAAEIGKEILDKN